MNLNDEQNIAFMKDPRRVSAENELHDILLSLQSDININGSAQYYLTVLPPLLKKLETAYVKLITVEATVKTEILNKLMEEN